MTVEQIVAELSRIHPPILHTGENTQTCLICQGIMPVHKPNCLWAAAVLHVQKTQARTHELKTEPEYYDAVARTLKTAEIRLNDRNFKVGDQLILRKWSLGRYTGDCIKTEITHILDDQRFMQPGYVMLSFRSALTFGVNDFPSYSEWECPL